MIWIYCIDDELNMKRLSRGKPATGKGYSRKKGFS
jgi:hypothetical protein